MSVIRFDRGRSVGASNGTVRFGGARGLGTGGGSAPSGDWLLAGGIWNDAGVWRDDAAWED